MSCLKKITRDCSTPNQPGVKAVAYFVAVDDIDTFPDLKATTDPGDSVTLDGDITLKATKEWVPITFQVKNSKFRSDKTGEPGAGGGFNNFFEAFLPGMTSVEIEAISCFNAPCGMVVLVQQKNGTLRVLGDPDEPAYAETLAMDTGLTGTDKSGTTVTLTAEGDIPSPVYEGTITPIAS